MMQRAKTMSAGASAFVGAKQETVGDVFRRFDADGSGSLDAKELRNALQDLKIDASAPAAEEAIAKIEASGSPGLSKLEFRTLVKGLKVARV